MAMIEPAHLWQQAHDEFPDDAGLRRARYQELMVKAGHIVNREPGDTRPVLPCRPDDLLTDEQKAQLQADLARLAERRRRVEVEHRNDRMA